MKSYNKILLLLLSFTCLMISMSSCSEKNFDTEEEIVTTTEPDTLNEVVVRGQITDLNGELLTNATVELLHGENIQTTVTDNLGNYIFDDLPSSNEKVTLRTSANGFVTRLGVTHLNKPVLEKDYILASLDDINQEGSPSASLLTTNVFELSGKILLDDGSPAENIKIIMLDISFTNWLYAITDENGEWSIVTEPRDNIFIAARYDCANTETIEEDISIIDEDIDLGTFESEFAPFDEVTFAGFVTDCNTNEGLLFGTVLITFEGNNKTYSGNISNGVYFVTANNCGDAECYDIKIDSGEETISETCQDLPSLNVSNNYTLCGPIIVESNEGDFTLTVGQETLTFPFVTIAKESGFDLWLISGGNFDTEQILVLQTPTNTVGTGNANGFAIANLALEAEYVSLDSESVTYTIDSVTTEFVYGSVNGTVVNANFTPLPISGNFKAVIEQ